jgi:hypothetical protein
MKSIRFWFVVLGWNLLCFALLLEISGNILYWSEHGEVFFLRARPPAGTVAPPEPFSSGDFRPILHPYFGYLYTEGTAGRPPFHVNNNFFVQERGYVERHPGCCDFPVVERKADEVIIGIFGGSVASALAVAAQHDEFLPRLLQIRPPYAGKRIRVLNFAAGAHKQPQQLQILAYYLSIGQKFDAVVTIEGFNEVKGGTDNAKAGVSVDFPATTWRQLAQFVDEQATRPQAASLLRAYHDISAREWARYADSCRSAACYLLAGLASAWHRWGEALPPSVAPGRWRPTYFAVYPADAGNAFKLIADHWASSVVLMHRLLAAQSTPFLVMLQPNQWFRSTVPFKGGRSQSARNDLPQIVPEGYRALLARVPALHASGISVLDETGLFDSHDDEIYSDDYAHFTEEGNQMLVKEVANWLENRQ